MERTREIRSPLGGLNTDDDDILIPATDYRDARNCVADVASFKNAPGNVSALSFAVNSGFAMPRAINRSMGVAKDEKNNALIEFVWNSNGAHCIIRWYKDTNRLQYILDSQSILNFDYTKEHLINNPFVVDNLLYWTDNYNPPRKIDIDKAIRFTENPYIYTFDKMVRVPDYFTEYSNVLGLLFYSWDVDLYAGQKIVVTKSDVIRQEQTGETTVVTVYKLQNNQLLVVTDRPYYVDDSSGVIYNYNSDGQYYGLTEQNISRMKYSPPFSPTTSYMTDVSRANNFLKNKFFFFRIRYFYDNHEYSTWSPFSLVNYPQEDLEYGYSWEASNMNNYLNVWYWTGTLEVIRIEIAVKESTSEIWKLVDRIEKYDADGNVILPSDIYHPYEFYNDVDGEGLDQIELAKLFNNVPELCGASDLIGDNRIIDGDITEGKDNVDIDVSLSIEAIEAQFPQPITLIQIIAGMHYRYDDNDGVLMDIPGKMVTLRPPAAVPPLFQDTMWIVKYTVSSVNEAESDTNPYTRFSFSFFPDATDTLQTMCQKICDTTNQSSGRRVRCYYPGPPYPQYPLIEGSFYTALGWATWVAYPQYSLIFARWVVEDTGVEPNLLDDDVPLVYLIAVEITRYDSKTLKYPSYKYASMLYGGIIYYDAAGRMGGVNKSSDSQIQIPNLDEVNKDEWELYDPNNTTDLVTPKYIKISYEINHRPPLWARYWSWATAKNTPVFRYAIASDFKCMEGKTYFNVDVFLSDMIEDIPNGSVRPYYFQKGDRVRFVGGIVSASDPTQLGWQNVDWHYDDFRFASFDRLGVFLDFEIIGEYYDEILLTADEQNYKHYKDMTYWLDNDGNRVRNLYYRKLYVQGFDASVYNITEHDSYVFIPRYYSGALVEIYTPNQNLTTDEKNVIYFESNQVYDVGNSGTSLAYHKADVNQAADLSSPATGYLNCQNVFLRLRTYESGNYKLPVEDVNLSDYYESNIHNTGRINKFIYDSQRQRYFGKLQFSGVYYENSMVNNLSSVDTADFKILSEKFGKITGLHEIGSTLKVLQEYKRTSIRINKVGLVQATGQQEIVAATERLLGDIDIHEDDYGCQDPESVLVVERSLVFYDRSNGKLVRDYSNGPVAISDLKTTVLFQGLKDSILTGGSNVFINTGFDNFNDNIYVLVMSLDSLATPTFIDCIGFSTKRNRFVSRYDFQTDDGISGELIGNMGDKFVIFMDGVPWVHGQGTNCNFFGTQWYPKVKFTFNGGSSAEHIWENIAIISNGIWCASDNDDIFIKPNATYPRGMCSRLVASRFTNIRGVAHADFLRNMLTTSATPKLTDLHEGELLDSHTIDIQISSPETSEVILESVIVQSLIHK